MYSKFFLATLVLFLSVLITPVFSNQILSVDSNEGILEIYFTSLDSSQYPIDIESSSQISEVFNLNELGTWQSIGTINVTSTTIVSAPFTNAFYLELDISAIGISDLSSNTLNITFANGVNQSYDYLQLFLSTLNLDSRISYIGENLELSTCFLTNNLANCSQSTQFSGNQTSFIGFKDDLSTFSNFSQLSFVAQKSNVNVANFNFSPSGVVFFEILSFDDQDFIVTYDNNRFRVYNFSNYALLDSSAFVSNVDAFDFSEFGGSGSIPFSVFYIKSGSLFEDNFDSRTTVDLAFLDVNTRIGQDNSNNSFTTGVPTSQFNISNSENISIDFSNSPGGNSFICSIDLPLVKSNDNVSGDVLVYYNGSNSISISSSSIDSNELFLQSYLFQTPFSFTDLTQNDTITFDNLFSGISGEDCTFQINLGSQFPIGSQDLYIINDNLDNLSLDLTNVEVLSSSEENLSLGFDFPNSNITISPSLEVFNFDPILGVGSGICSLDLASTKIGLDSEVKISFDENDYTFNTQDILKLSEVIEDNLYVSQPSNSSYYEVDNSNKFPLITNLNISGQSCSYQFNMIKTQNFNSTFNIEIGTENITLNTSDILSNYTDFRYYEGVSSRSQDSSFTVGRNNTIEFLDLFTLRLFDLNDDLSTFGNCYVSFDVCYDGSLDNNLTVSSGSFEYEINSSTINSCASSYSTINMPVSCQDLTSSINEFDIFCEDCDSSNYFNFSLTNTTSSSTSSIFYGTSATTELFNSQGFDPYVNIFTNESYDFTSFVFEASCPAGDDISVYCPSCNSNDNFAFEFKNSSNSNISYLVSTENSFDFGVQSFPISCDDVDDGSFSISCSSCDEDNNLQVFTDMNSNLLASFKISQVSSQSYAELQNSCDFFNTDSFEIGCVNCNSSDFFSFFKTQDSNGGIELNSESQSGSFIYNLSVLGNLNPSRVNVDLPYCVQDLNISCDNCNSSDFLILLSNLSTSNFTTFNGSAINDVSLDFLSNSSTSQENQIYYFNGVGDLVKIDENGTEQWAFPISDFGSRTIEFISNISSSEELISVETSTAIYLIDSSGNQKLKLSNLNSPKLFSLSNRYAVIEADLDVFFYDSNFNQVLSRNLVSFGTGIQDITSNGNELIFLIQDESNQSILFMNQFGVVSYQEQLLDPIDSIYYDLNSQELYGYDTSGIVLFQFSALAKLNLFFENSLIYTSDDILSGTLSFSVLNPTLSYSPQTSREFYELVNVSLADSSFTNLSINSVQEFNQSSVLNITDIMNIRLISSIVAGQSYYTNGINVSSISDLIFPVRQIENVSGYFGGDYLVLSNNFQYGFCSQFAVDDDIKLGSVSSQIGCGLEFAVGNNNSYQVLFSNLEEFVSLTNQSGVITVNSQDRRFNNFTNNLNLDLENVFFEITPFFSLSDDFTFVEIEYKGNTVQLDNFSSIPTCSVSEYGSTTIPLGYTTQTISIADTTARLCIVTGTEVFRLVMDDLDALENVTIIENRFTNSLPNLNNSLTSELSQIWGYSKNLTFALNDLENDDVEYQVILKQLSNETVLLTANTTNNATINYPVFFNESYFDVPTYIEVRYSDYVGGSLRTLKTSNLVEITPLNRNITTNLTQDTNILQYHVKDGITGENLTSARCNFEFETSPSSGSYQFLGIGVTNSQGLCSFVLPLDNEAGLYGTRVTVDNTNYNSTPIISDSYQFIKSVSLEVEIDDTLIRGDSLSLNISLIDDFSSSVISVGGSSCVVNSSIGNTVQALSGGECIVILTPADACLLDLGNTDVNVSVNLGSAYYNPTSFNETYSVLISDVFNLTIDNPANLDSFNSSGFLDYESSVFDSCGNDVTNENNFQWSYRSQNSSIPVLFSSLSQGTWEIPSFIGGSLELIATASYPIHSSVINESVFVLVDSTLSFTNNLSSGLEFNRNQQTYNFENQLVGPFASNATEFFNATLENYECVWEFDDGLGGITNLGNSLTNSDGKCTLDYAFDTCSLPLGDYTLRTYVNGNGSQNVLKGTESKQYDVEFVESLYHQVSNNVNATFIVSGDVNTSSEFVFGEEYNFGVSITDSCGSPVTLGTDNLLWNVVGEGTIGSGANANVIFTSGYELNETVRVRYIQEDGVTYYKSYSQDYPIVIRNEIYLENYTFPEIFSTSGTDTFTCDFEVDFLTNESGILVDFVFNGVTYQRSTNYNGVAVLDLSSSQPTGYHSIECRVNSSSRSDLEVFDTTTIDTTNLVVKPGAFSRLNNDTFGSNREYDFRFSFPGNLIFPDGLNSNVVYRSQTDYYEEPEVMYFALGFFETGVAGSSVAGQELILDGLNVSMNIRKGSDNSIVYTDFCIQNSSFDSLASHVPVIQADVIDTYLGYPCLFEWNPDTVEVGEYYVDYDLQIGNYSPLNGTYNTSVNVSTIIGGDNTISSKVVDNSEFIGESGIIELVNDTLTTITFDLDYNSTPVIIATPEVTSFDSSDSAYIVRVHSIGTTSATISLCKDGANTTCETGFGVRNVSYSVFDVDKASKYSWLDVGLVNNVPSNDSGISFNFTESFSNVPFIWGQSQTYTANSTIAPGIYFESNSLSNATVASCIHNTTAADICKGGTLDTIGYVAIDIFSEELLQFDSGYTFQTNNDWNTINFAEKINPALFLIENNENGDQDFLSYEYRDFTNSSAIIRFCEVEGLTDYVKIFPYCDTHNSETLAWFATESGNLEVSTGSKDYLQLDEIDDYVMVPSNPSLDLSGGEFTISVWINHDNLSSFRSILGEEGVASFERYPVIYTSGEDTLHYGFGNGSTWGARIVFGVISPFEWYHVVYRYSQSSSTESLFVNGILVDSGGESRTPISKDNLNIGFNGNQATKYQGGIDELMIFNESLSDIEIENIYNLDRREYPNTEDINLVGYWNFDNNLRDSSQYSNDGVGVGDYQILTENNKRVAEFDGVDDYFEVPHFDELSGDLSVSLWVNPSTQLSGFPTLIFQSSNQSSKFWGASDFGIGLDDVDATRIRYGIDGESLLTSSGALSLNEWNHIILTYDNSTQNVSIYVDNELVDSIISARSLSSLSKSLIFGSRHLPNNYYTGKMDEVMIYNKTLSSLEIQNLYALNRTPQVFNDSDLRGYWNFEGGFTDASNMYDYSNLNQGYSSDNFLIWDDDFCEDTSQYYRHEDFEGSGSEHVIVTAGCRLSSNADNGDFATIVNTTLHEGSYLRVETDYLGSGDDDFSGLVIYDKNADVWWVGGITENTGDSGINKYEGPSPVSPTNVAVGSNENVATSHNFVFEYNETHLNFYINGTLHTSYANSSIDPFSAGIVSNGQADGGGANYDNLKIYTNEIQLKPDGVSYGTKIVNEIESTYADSKGIAQSFADVFTGTDIDSINQITIGLEVDLYNTTLSTQRSNLMPELEVEIYDGSSYQSLGMLGVTTEGYYTISTTNSTILTAWMNVENRDIRITPYNLDYYSYQLYDEIQWSDLAVEIDYEYTTNNLVDEYNFEVWGFLNVTIEDLPSLISVNETINLVTTVLDDRGIEVNSEDVTLDYRSWSEENCVLQGGSWIFETINGENDNTYAYTLDRLDDLPKIYNIQRQNQKWGIGTYARGDYYQSKDIFTSKIPEKNTCESQNVDNRLSFYVEDFSVEYFLQAEIISPTSLVFGPDEGGPNDGLHVVTCSITNSGNGLEPSISTKLLCDNCTSIPTLGFNGTASDNSNHLTEFVFNLSGLDDKETYNMTCAGQSTVWGDNIFTVTENQTSSYIFSLTSGSGFGNVNENYSFPTINLQTYEDSGCSIPTEYFRDNDSKYFGIELNKGSEDMTEYLMVVLGTGISRNDPTINGISESQCINDLTPLTGTVSDYQQYTIEFTLTDNEAQNTELDYFYVDNVLPMIDLIETDKAAYAPNTSVIVDINLSDIYIDGTIDIERVSLYDNSSSFVMNLTKRSGLDVWRATFQSPLLQGFYNYTIEVEDFAGWIVNDSFDVLIDGTAPEVQYFNADSGCVGGPGLEHVIGPNCDPNFNTNYSANDTTSLKFVAIYLNSSGTGLVELYRNDFGGVVTSTSSPSQDVNVYSYSDGASYTLEFVAEDVSDRRNISIIPIRIDKSAPSLASIDLNYGYINSTTLSNLSVVGVVIQTSPVTVLDLNITDGSSTTTLCTNLTNCNVDDDVSSFISGEGIYNLNISVEDLVGNSGIKSVSVIYDTTLPLVTITSPNASSYQDETITITAEVTDTNVDTGGVVYDFGTCTGSMTNSGGSTYTVTISDSTTCGFTVNTSQVITVNATDLAGNTNSDIETINVDTVNPVTVVSYPQTNQIISGTQQVIAIVDEDTQPFDLRYTRISSFGVGVNQENMTCSSIGGISYNCTATLDFTLVADGSNGVLFEFRDLAGNSQVQTIPIIIDNNPPILSSGEISLNNEVTLNNAQINGSRVANGSTFSTEITDAAGNLNTSQLYCEINGVNYSMGLDSGNRYECNPDISGVGDGANTLKFYATDFAGQTNSSIYNIIVDNTAPVLTLGVYPPVVDEDDSFDIEVNSTENMEGTILFISNSSDFSTISQTIGSPVSSFTESGVTFSTDLSSFNGNKVIRVNASDEAGNIVSQTITIEVDTSAPIIVSRDLVDDQIIGGAMGSFNFSYIVKDDNFNISRVILNETQNTLSVCSPINVTHTNCTGSFDTNVADGTYVVRIRAWDLVGNFADDSFNVVIDADAPLVTFTRIEDSDIGNDILPANTTIRPIRGDNFTIYFDAVDTAGNLNISDSRCILAPFGISSTSAVTSEGGNTYSCTLNESGNYDGIKIVRLQINDTLGQTNKTDVKIDVDNTAPIITSANFVSNSAINNSILVPGLSYHFNISINEPMGLDCSADVYNASNLLLWANWPLVTTTFTGNTCDPNGNHNTLDFNGELFFNFTIYDNAWNTVTTNFTIFRDSTPPVVNSILPANASILTGTNNVSIRFDEALFVGGKFRNSTGDLIADLSVPTNCSKNTFLDTNCTFEVDFNQFNDGNLVFTYDLEGEEGGTTNTTYDVTYTVDKNPPVISNVRIEDEQAGRNNSVTFDGLNNSNEFFNISDNITLFAQIEDPNLNIGGLNCNFNNGTFNQNVSMNSEGLDVYSCQMPVAFAISNGLFNITIFSDDILSQESIRNIEINIDTIAPSFLSYNLTPTILGINTSFTINLTSDERIRVCRFNLVENGTNVETIQIYSSLYSYNCNLSTIYDESTINYEFADIRLIIRDDVLNSDTVDIPVYIDTQEPVVSSFEITNAVAPLPQTNNLPSVSPGKNGTYVVNFTDNSITDGVANISQVYMEVIYSQTGTHNSSVFNLVNVTPNSYVANVTAAYFNVFENDTIFRVTAIDEAGNNKTQNLSVFIANAPPVVENITANPYNVEINYNQTTIAFNTTTIGEKVALLNFSLYVNGSEVDNFELNQTSTPSVAEDGGIVLFNYTPLIAGTYDIVATIQNEVFSFANYTFTNVFRGIGKSNATILVQDSINISNVTSSYNETTRVNVTLVNTGLSKLYLTRFQVVGGGFQLPQSLFTCNTLDIGENCTIEVEFRVNSLSGTGDNNMLFLLDWTDSDGAISNFVAENLIVNIEPTYDIETEILTSIDSNYTFEEIVTLDLKITNIGNTDINVSNIILDSTSTENIAINYTIPEITLSPTEIQTAQINITLSDLTSTYVNYTGLFNLTYEDSPQSFTKTTNSFNSRVFNVYNSTFAYNSQFSYNGDLNFVLNRSSIPLGVNTTCIITNGFNPISFESGRFVTLLNDGSYITNDTTDIFGEADFTIDQDEFTKGINVLECRVDDNLTDNVVDQSINNYDLIFEVYSNLSLSYTLDLPPICSFLFVSDSHPCAQGNLTVTLRDDIGNVVIGEDVEIYSNATISGLEEEIFSCTTDLAGECVFVWNPPVNSSGSYELDIRTNVSSSSYYYNTTLIDPIQIQQGTNAIINLSSSVFGLGDDINASIIILDGVGTDITNSVNYTVNWDLIGTSGSIFTTSNENFSLEVNNTLIGDFNLTAVVNESGLILTPIISFQVTRGGFNISIVRDNSSQLFRETNLSQNTTRNYSITLTDIDSGVPVQDANIVVTNLDAFGVQVYNCTTDISGQCLFTWNPDTLTNAGVNELFFEASKEFFQESNTSITDEVYVYVEPRLTLSNTISLDLTQDRELEYACRIVESFNTIESPHIVLNTTKLLEFPVDSQRVVNILEASDLTIENVSDLTSLSVVNNSQITAEMDSSTVSFVLNVDLDLDYENVTFNGINLDILDFNESSDTIDLTLFNGVSSSLSINSTQNYSFEYSNLTLIRIDYISSNIRNLTIENFNLYEKLDEYTIELSDFEVLGSNSALPSQYHGDFETGVIDGTFGFIEMSNANLSITNSADGSLYTNNLGVEISNLSSGIDSSFRWYPNLNYDISDYENFVFAIKGEDLELFEITVRFVDTGASCSYDYTFTTQNYSSSFVEVDTLSYMNIDLDNYRSSCSATTFEELEFYLKNINSTSIDSTMVYFDNFGFFDVNITPTNFYEGSIEIYDSGALTFTCLVEDTPYYISQISNVTKEILISDTSGEDDPAFSIVEDSSINSEAFGLESVEVEIVVPQFGYGQFYTIEILNFEDSIKDYELRISQDNNVSSFSSNSLTTITTQSSTISSSIVEVPLYLNLESINVSGNQRVNIEIEDINTEEITSLNLNIIPVDVDIDVLNIAQLQSEILYPFRKIDIETQIRINGTLIETLDNIDVDTLILNTESASICNRVTYINTSPSFEHTLECEVGPNRRSGLEDVALEVTLK